MAVPSFLYGVERWVLSKKDTRHIQAVETNLLRYVKEQIRTRNDRIRNDVIKHKLGVLFLNARIEECQLRRIERVGRMEAKRLPQQVLQ